MRVRDVEGDWPWGSIGGGTLSDRKHAEAKGASLNEKTYG